MFVSPREDFDFKPLWGGLVQLQGNLFYIDRLIGPFYVPNNFQCDLASYKVVSKVLFDKLGDSMRPAVVHDWIYTTQPVDVSRADADRIFREALILEEVNPKVAWLQWAGVRAGGWVAWNTHARRNAKKLRG